MKAIILDQPGDASRLQIQETDTPEIGSQDVLVRVKAISINPVDIKTREGKGIYGRIKDEKPLIIGWDIAGVVEKVGSHLSQFKAGDEVFGMVNFPGHGKAYAEYISVPEDQLARKPRDTSFQHAAASTLAALTAYQALVKKANIKSEQKVLIHAASGGVGHFAVQIAKHLGAYVVATSSAKNKGFVLTLGADEHIDYTNGELDTRLTQFDFVLDAIGGRNIERSLPLLKKGGTLISLPTSIDPSTKALAEASGIDAYFFLVESSGADMHEIAELLTRGILKPYVSATFPFMEISKAHQAVESGRTVGKIIVTI